MSEHDATTALDRDAIERLVQAMPKQELAISRDVMIDLRERGAGISSSAVAELAKKYADKARRLAGDGGE